jgi:O-antigen ligase
MRFADIGIFGEPRFWFICILLILGLFLTVKDKTLPKSQSSYARLWLSSIIIFHIYMVVTYIWSPASDYSRSILLSLFILIILLIETYVVFRNNTLSCLKLFLYLILAASILFSLGGILFKDAFGVQHGRYAFLWGGPNVYVRIVLSGIFVLLYLWLKTGNILWLSVIPLILYAGIMSGSRGGVLSFFISLTLTIFFSRKRFFKIAVLVVVISFAIIAFLYLPSFSSLREQVETRYPLNINQLREQYYKNLRSELYRLAIKSFKENPALGIGIGGYQYNYGYVYPHNLFLNIAAEGGAMGLILIIISVLLLMFGFRVKKSIENNMLFIIGFYYLLASMISGSYYDWRYIWVMFLLFLMPINTIKNQ